MPKNAKHLSPLTAGELCIIVLCFCGRIFFASLSVSSASPQDTAANRASCHKFITMLDVIPGSN